MYLGLDIGTTSICALVLDKSGKTVYSKTLANNFTVSGKKHEKMQDAVSIFKTCKMLYDDAKTKFSLKSVGISNQMHGILYVDSSGNALSPLITWQDGRGNLVRKKDSYAKELSEKTGYNMATGFGATTVFYDNENNAVPEGTTCFCTVGDYVAMHLCKKSKPIMHESNAHSMGLYDLKNHCWDEIAIEKAGIDVKLFPTSSASVELFGKTDDGVCVYLAIGDNQASVYGVETNDDTVIVNIGTGSQVSIISNKFVAAPKSCELRPYLNGKYLLIGGALCGGYSYQLLKNFYNSVLEFAGIEITYDVMNKMAESAENSDLPIADTKFKGTRENPAEKASFSSITAENFNAASFTLAVLKGISGELKEFYNKMVAVTSPRKNLVGSGNAIRMNPVLQRIISADYGAELKIPSHTEEAAFGAAIIAAEQYENKSLKHFIEY